MQVLLDRLVNMFKWPVAIGLFLSLPAFIDSIDYFHFASFKYLAMFGGFFVFFIARSFMDSSARIAMETLAHELTHALFAVLTLHKVSGIKINQDDSGGNMTFEGEGNWLIIIAPYFFPFFGAIAMVAISIYTMFAPMNLAVNGFLGFFIGYHLDTVGSQIHDKQTDLPKVGYPFCAVFILPANLWMIGSMMAFNSRGWDGVWAYQQLVLKLDQKNFDYIANLLGF